MTYQTTKFLAEQHIADLQAEARARRLAAEARAGEHRDFWLTDGVKAVARVGPGIVARLRNVRVGRGPRLASGRHGA
jgi:hypothetical protein